MVGTVAISRSIPIICEWGRGRGGMPGQSWVGVDWAGDIGKIWI